MYGGMTGDRKRLADNAVMHGQPVQLSESGGHVITGEGQPSSARRPPPRLPWAPEAETAAGPAGQLQARSRPGSHPPDGISQVPLWLSALELLQQVKSSRRSLRLCS